MTSEASSAGAGTEPAGRGAEASADGAHGGRTTGDEAPGGATRETADELAPVLRILGRRAGLLYALFVVTHVVLAVANLDAVASPVPTLVALAPTAVAGALLLASRTDPLPAVVAAPVVSLGLVVTVLVTWSLSPGSTAGYDAWNFGAVTFLLFALALRGRSGWAWIGFALMTGVAMWWSVLVGRGWLGAVDFVIRHAGTLLVATLFALLLRRTSRRIARHHRQQVESIRAEAAALSRIRVRDGVLEDLEREARPALERIAAGGDLSPYERQEFLMIEESLRDALRAGNLAGSAVLQAARAARLRGVSVLLLDDRDEPLGASDRARVEHALLSVLAGAQDGQVSARILPAGSAALALITVEDARGQRRVEVTAA